MGGESSSASDNSETRRNQRMLKDIEYAGNKINELGGKLDTEARQEILALTTKGIKKEAGFLGAGKPTESFDTTEFIKKSIENSLNRKGSVGSAYGRRLDYRSLLTAKKEAPGITEQTGTTNRKRSLITRGASR